MKSSGSWPGSNPGLTTEAFRGTVWRHIPKGGHVLNMYHVLHAKGRFNRPGEFGALYTSRSVDGASAEHAKWLELSACRAIDPPRDLVAVNLAVRPVINLSDPAVRRQLSVSLSVLTGDRPKDRERCRQIADIVRSLGIWAIRHPSAALKGGENLVIYPEVTPVDFYAEVGERRPLNYEPPSV